MNKIITCFSRIGLLLLVITCFSCRSLFAQNESAKRVLVFSIMEEIAKPAWRTTQQAFAEAKKQKSDYILLHLNTYGGRVDIADSIRTKIINSDIPVLLFIDNQAISAGALISIACDSIYMRSGGNIGAATVVDQSGAQVPDKYQSFMRSTMRSTAQSHGKDTIIKNGDTTFVWRRNPDIAQAMVDPSVKYPGVVDSGHVLTLTAEEAMKVGYCQGLANNIPEVLKNAHLSDASVYYYKPTGRENIIRFFLNPIVQGILIVLIIGGIYFELQAPGIGLPLGLAVTAALLYFVPLYFEGLAQNWEILVFIAGIVLLALEIFVIPGFGVAGVSGILLILIGLTMALVDNVVFEYQGVGAFHQVVNVFLRVVIFVVIAFVISIYISKKIGTSRWFSGLGLEAVQNSSEGYISFDNNHKEMVGKIGEAYTVLRPSGRVMIGDQIFDAVSEIGFIEKGERVKVSREETGQLYVIKSV